MKYVGKAKLGSRESTPVRKSHFATGGTFQINL
jgi:hypothetical protein